MRSAPKKRRAERERLDSGIGQAERGSFQAGLNLEGTGIWKKVIDLLDSDISIHTATGELVYANQSLLDRIGMKASEAIGLSCAQLFHTAGSVCPHDEVSETKRGACSEGRLKDGRGVFSVSIMPVDDVGGRPGGYIRIMRDVTESRRIQEELSKAEQFATLSQMISGIAHDLGTPLNIISGYAEYLLMRTKPEAQGHKELSTILEQTRRIADFIRQMLDLSRPAQNRTDAIELRSFLTESIELMGHHFRKAEVKASVAFKTDPPILYANAAELKRAVFNLLLSMIGQIGQGGRLEVSVEESSQRPGYTAIILRAMENDGKGHDFSSGLDGFISNVGGNDSAGLILSVARETFKEFGAEMDCMTGSGPGVPLVIFLPRKR